MRETAAEIVVGVVLLSPGRGSEKTQPTRGSATYSHFTQPHGLLQNTDWIVPLWDLHIVSPTPLHLCGIFPPHEDSVVFTQLTHVVLQL